MQHAILRKCIEGGTVVVLMLGMPVHGAERAEPLGVALDLSTRYESNLNRAAEPEIESDQVFTVDAIATKRILLGKRSGVVVSGGLQAERLATFTDLNRVAATGSIRYHVKPVPGYGAPWFAAHVAADGLKHQDSVIRDGLAARIGVTAGKRMSTRLSVRAGYLYDRRWAYEKRVFETRGHRGFASASYAITSKLSFRASYAYREGDVVSTAVRTDRIGNASSAIAPDDAFGRGTPVEVEPRTFTFIPFPGATPVEVPLPDDYLGGRQFDPDQRFAYRLDGETHSASAGFSYDLDRSSSIEVGARYFDTSADGNNHYDGYAVSAGLVIRLR